MRHSNVHKSKTNTKRERETKTKIEKQIGSERERKTETKVHFGHRKASHHVDAIKYSLNSHCLLH